MNLDNGNKEESLNQLSLQEYRHLKILIGLCGSLSLFTQTIFIC